ncbi:MAG: flagellar motor switch protein FliN [Treponema sp.]|nr:flagellar motor switch protein FliN [Treponema sp.]
MSDGAISQEEIDALLSGQELNSIIGGGFGSSAPFPKDMDLSVIKDFAGDVAQTLSQSLETMTGLGFDVGAPIVESLNRDALLRKLPEMVVAIFNDFSDGLTGDHTFILSGEFAQKLAGLINKEENPELDDMTISVVSEIVSQHSGNEVTLLSKTGSLSDLACIPAEGSYVPKAMVRIPQTDFVLVTYPISGDGSAFTLWEVLSANVVKGMINALGGDSSSDMGALSAAELQGLGAMSSEMDMGGMSMGGMNTNSMNMGNMQMQQPMGGMNMGGMNMMPQMGGMNIGMNVPNVQSLQFPNLHNSHNMMAEQGNIGLIMDVFMEMTVELGRTKKQIKEILGFGEGTIIELDKLAGEPVDILVNHKPIAKGEVVVIDENFGVRITEILSPVERVSDLH